MHAESGLVPPAPQAANAVETCSDGHDRFRQAARILAVGAVRAVQSAKAEGTAPADSLESNESESSPFTPV